MTLHEWAIIALRRYGIIKAGQGVIDSSLLNFEAAGNGQRVKAAGPKVENIAGCDVTHGKPREAE